MDQIEQIVSGLMMPIKKEVNDAYVLDELETKLSSQLARQYVKGWYAGRKDLVQELQQKTVGGHK